MMITIDLDNATAKDVKLTLKIAKAYGLQLIRINRSFSKQGFHLIFYIHKTQLEHLDFLDVPRELKPIVRERYFEAIAKYDDRVAILRYILGDDPNRIEFDLAKGDVLPREVLFNVYVGKRVSKATEIRKSE